MLVQHNVPLTDHLSPLLKNVFPDSDIAKKYACASTKTTCIINGSLAPFFKSTLVTAMKQQAFSIAIDVLNDTGLEKMNPTTVCLYDSSEGKICTMFLDMCTTKGKSCFHNDVSVPVHVGKECGTAASILEKWTKCLLPITFLGLIASALVWIIPQLILVGTTP